jgi:hypothetical protein
MKKIFISLLITVLFTGTALCATFSGANLPYEGAIHLGLVNGPGTGISLGADMYYPINGFLLGGEVEQQVTNSDFDQNINITKFGFTTKFTVTDWAYLSVHLGKSSFYLAKSATYIDSLNGDEIITDDDYHGSATYVAIGANFLVGEFIVTPKVGLNYITDGGTLFEMDLSVGHNF